MGKLNLDEIKRAIREAKPEETNASIAKRLGIRQDLVWYHRNQMRKRDAAKAEAGSPPSQNVLRSRPVTLNVDEKTLDAWWSAQSLDQKAIVFAGNFSIRVEGVIQ